MVWIKIEVFGCPKNRWKCPVVIKNILVCDSNSVRTSAALLSVKKNKGLVSNTGKPRLLDTRLAVRHWILLAIFNRDIHFKYPLLSEAF